MKRMLAVGIPTLILCHVAAAQTAQQTSPPPSSVAAPAAAPNAQPAGTDNPDYATLPGVNVIGATPLLGSGVDRNKVPAASNVLTNSDIVRTGIPNALGALNDQVGGVSLQDAQDNPFQPNLVYRGFQASPLQGNEQGLAVYVNGVRFNQPFGDTVNWDLFPDIAIQTMNLEGSNPTFGLNALGGSLSVQLKDGFNYHGGEFTAYGGTGDRWATEFQYGKQSGNWAAYVAGNVLNESGWRDESPSRLRQIYADIGFRSDKFEGHLNIIGADNTLTGNGSSPTPLLNIDRSAIFTFPDLTKNKYTRVALSGNWTINDNTSLQAVTYYQNLSQRTLNGDASDLEQCDDDDISQFVCPDDGDEPATFRGPNGTRPNIPFINSTFGLAQLNETATDTNGYGVSAQVNDQRDLGHFHNHFIAGFSFDGAQTTFTAVSFLGQLTGNRGFNGFDDGSLTFPIDLEDQTIAPVRTNISNAYLGAYFADIFDVTPRLSVNVSGRFNYASIDLTDLNGTSLNGNHTYTHFNPGVGVTYRFMPRASVYASYSIANRAPTPAELACASPTSPCTLTNFFVGDPDLKQVIAHTFEFGVRGSARVAAKTTVDFNADYFHTDADDDIEMLTSQVIGASFFQNIGATTRQGVEAGVTLRSGPVRAWLSYAFTRATFDSAFTETSELNPGADENDEIHIKPGDKLPGVPEHRLKFGADWEVTSKWKLGFSGIASTGQYLFGDEANLTPQTGGYVVLNANTAYQATRNVQLFALLQNLMNVKYETFGTFSPTNSVFPKSGTSPSPGPQLSSSDRLITRSLSPAPPISVFGGVRVTF